MLTVALSQPTILLAMSPRASFWLAVLLLIGSAGHALASAEIGAYVGNPDHTAPTADEVNAFEDLAGRHLSSVLVYWAWNDGDFPAEALNSGVRYHDGYDTQTILHLTWEPWSRNGGGDTSYSLDRIIAGEFDVYITKFAQDAAAWGDPIRLRFMHEMIQDNNASTVGWYPWQDRPTEYVQAFAHVRGIFEAQGATNVEWVWAPNNFPVDVPTLSLYYPGQSLVDWLGMDGYNAGEDGQPGWPYWQNFDDLFFNFYHNLNDNPQIFGDKPIMVAEFASVEGNFFDPRDKPEWITQTFNRMRTAYPEIAAFYWFHTVKENDWRIDSSPESQAAFMAAMQNPYFTSHPIPEPGTLGLLAIGLLVLLRACHASRG
jgi:beta-mannanase